MKRDKGDQEAAAPDEPTSSIRGMPIALPEWWLQRARAAAEASGMSARALGEALGAFRDHDEPWSQPTVHRFLQNVKTSEELALCFVEYFRLNRPIFHPEDEAEAVVLEAAQAATRAIAKGARTALPGISKQALAASIAEALREVVDGFAASMRDAALPGEPRQTPREGASPHATIGKNATTKRTGKGGPRDVQFEKDLAELETRQRRRHSRGVESSADGVADHSRRPSPVGGRRAPSEGD
jgi:hypothetical protein